MFNNTNTNLKVYVKSAARDKRCATSTAKIKKSVNDTHMLSDLLLEPVNQKVVVGLRQSCDLPQQVSVDHISAGA